MWRWCFDMLTNFVRRTERQTSPVHTTYIGRHSLARSLLASRSLERCSLDFHSSALWLSGMHYFSLMLQQFAELWFEKFRFWRLEGLANVLKVLYKLLFHFCKFSQKLHFCKPISAKSVQHRSLREVFCAKLISRQIKFNIVAQLLVFLLMSVC